MESARVNRRGWVKGSQRYFCLGPEPLVHRPCLTGIRVPGLGWSGFKSMSSSGLSIPSRHNSHPPLDPTGQATLRGGRPAQRIGEPDDSERLEPADSDQAGRWDVILILQRRRRTKSL